MTESLGAYIDRMLERGPMITSDGMWLMQRNDSQRLAMDIFMVIKDRALYKKLSGDSEPYYADGREIQQAINPGWKSFAFYWLRQAPVEAAFIILKEAKLIDKQMRGRAPYGYGDDEQFWLTSLATNLITKAKTNARIEDGVQNIFDERMSKSYRR